jgi:hypothetical protein
VVTVTPPAVPSVPGSAGPEAADEPTAGVLAGVAREVEQLRRAVEPLLELPQRVDDLTRLATDLTNAVAALTARRTTTPCPSWLLLPADPDLAQRVLDELVGWLPWCICAIRTGRITCRSAGSGTPTWSKSCCG